MQASGIRRLVVGLVSTVTAATAWQAAEAAPLAGPIASWNFTVNSGWNNTTWDSSGPGSNSYVPTNPYVVQDGLTNGQDFNGAGQYDIVKWGTPRTSNGQSFLAVDDKHSNTVLTNDLTGARGANVYHGNYTQGQGSANEQVEKWLDATTLTASITISPQGAEGLDFGPFTRSFEIDFRETPNNNVDVTKCPGGFSKPVVGCPDYFDISLLNATFTTSVIGGYKYTFSLIFDPTDSTYLRADPSDGSVRIWTAENALSRLATRVIVTAEVPEPGVVGLMGLGLVAVGWARRRRRG